MSNALSDAAPTPSDDNPVHSGKIVFQRVSKTFLKESAPAVDQVSFRVAAGDMVVFLGPSGCGKTTLLKMVNRLYEPSEGEIWMDGKEIHSLAVNDLRRQIGYVIQQVGLFPHMTIGKNISIVPRLLGWKEDITRERVASLLELIGLPMDYLTRYPRQLSGGEQQRVGLARALAADPSILLMDEPFAAVDAINRTYLQGELLDLHCKLNKTILFVTHDVDEAFRLADKIIVMRKGKLIQYGTPLEIVSHPQNEFIEELVGSKNMLRRLSLVNVQSILKSNQKEPPQALGSRPFDKQPAVIHPEDDLRYALTVLLSSGSDVLRVVNSSGDYFGEVRFSDLRSMLYVNAGDVEEKAKCDELSDP